MTASFTIVCPAFLKDKISVIKSIRTLTSMDLKEAKAVSECTTEQTFEIDTRGYLQVGWQADLLEVRIQREFENLRANGVKVYCSSNFILHKLKQLGQLAEKNGFTDLAVEIEYLLTAELLRQERK